MLIDISIHAPLTGSDLRDLTDDMYLCVFQSTLPLRGATFENFAFVSGAGISIHAPLTGSDRVVYQTRLSRSDFNPRSPYGERP